MESRKQIRTRMAATQSALQFTRAMKLMSATRIRRATEAMLRFRPYANAMQGLMARMHEVIEAGAFRHYFLARPPERIAIILVAGDRGLCGAFNAAVARKGIALLEGPYATQHARGDVMVYCVGRKALQHLRRGGYTGDARFLDIQRVSSLEGAFRIGDYMTDLFERRELDRVEIVYHRFKNVVSQVLMHETVLPVPAAPAPADPTEDVVHYFEPDEHQVVGRLVSKYVEVQVYRALVESQAAELAARMLAMDKAHDNAETLLAQLKLEFNQARQAAITREIAEIVAGDLGGVRARSG